MYLQVQLLVRLHLLSVPLAAGKWVHFICEWGWHSQVALLGEMTYKIGSTFRSSTRHGHGAMRHAEITACGHNASASASSCNPVRARPGQARLGRFRPVPTSPEASRIVNCTCRLLLRSTACGGGRGRAEAWNTD